MTTRTIERHEVRATVRVAEELRQGERLGLYEVLSRSGPVTVAQFAQEALLPHSFARRWLESQAAAGFLVFDPYDETFSNTCILWCEWPRREG